MESKKSTACNGVGVIFSGFSFWAAVFIRAMKDRLTTTMAMIILMLPWLILQWTRIKTMPESHKEESNPFIYTMQ